MIRKLIFIVLIFSQSVTFGQYNLTSDTTVSGPWSLGNTILTIAPGVKIHGSGSISGGYISANFYQSIFDTSLNTSGINGGSLGKVSSTWFGASPSNTDNTPYFQKAVNACKNKNTILYIPAGSYNDSMPIIITNYTSGDYQVVSINIKGDYRMNDAIIGTQINYKNVSGGAFQIQLAKGMRLEGIAFSGRFVSPSRANLQTYYNTSYSNFTDANGICQEMLSGIQLDPYTPNSGHSGSTAVDIYNCSFTGFTVGIFMSASGGNGITLNCELITIDHCNFGDLRCAVRGAQAQEKMNEIKNCMAWGNMYCFFTTGIDWEYQSGSYHIHDINIAGRVISVFYVNQGGWFPLKADHIYAESIGSIGTLNTASSGNSGANGMGIDISSSVFQFEEQSVTGLTYLCNTNSVFTIFRSCDFTFFDGTSNKPILFNGLAAFDRCTFNGIYSNSTVGSVFYPNCRFM